jgi:exopolysaccharide/PEP-CTERM locus tyrosine autokinase
MSIIEKAIDRLGEEPPAPRTAADAAPVAEAPRERSTIEAALTSAPPVPAAPDAAGAAPASPPLDVLALGLEGIISPHSERSRTPEEYRMIKRPLLQRAFGGDAPLCVHRNVVMVTSSVAGEGKTFTSLNLAISIAMEMDRTVLLVDADLAKPGLSKLLRMQDSPGLTDRLLDANLDLKDLLRRTDVPKLTVLSAGRRHRRSTELLASNAMKDLLDELAQRYADRVVLFDSPPLLATSEASVLAEQMGQICVVVESGATPQFLVKEALDLLQHKDRVSLVLNKTKRDLLSGQGSYYYGYRYGSGYGHEKDAAEA